jgi:uncharacterized short protein YbdD (DUF466 family)
MALLHGIVRGARGLAWFVKGVMGEDAYDKYLAHHAATHAGADAAQHPPLTAKQFWRERTDRQDADPGARCC